jgi:hypothetical protein
MSIWNKPGRVTLATVWLAGWLYGCRTADLPATVQILERTPVALELRLPTPTVTQLPAEPFSGQRALKDVEIQTGFGPRLPDSQAHRQTEAYIKEQLIAAGWQVEIQDAGREQKPIRNILAKRGSGRPWIVIGAHYDSRMWADRDPDPQKRSQPVPGANDGASGAAVLLELGRVYPGGADQAPAAGRTLRANQIWLVFFDAEDNGGIEGWDWIEGSRAFVDRLAEHPDAAVILDMVGDRDLNIYQEKNSDPKLTNEIWGQAGKLGFGDRIIPQPKYSMLDDHTPFLQAGIPAVDLIDFDYPAWHTTGDTADQVSAESLEAVGRVILAWLGVDLP